MCGVQADERGLRRVWVTCLSFLDILRIPSAFGGVIVGLEVVLCVTGIDLGICSIATGIYYCL